MPSREKQKRPKITDISESTVDAENTKMSNSLRWMEVWQNFYLLVAPSRVYVISPTREWSREDERWTARDDVNYFSLFIHSVDERNDENSFKREVRVESGAMRFSPESVRVVSNCEEFHNLFQGSLVLMFNLCDAIRCTSSCVYARRE